MSAWYVFSALGFYPTNPVGGVYVIGSPLVRRATLHLDRAHYSGRTFTIIADRNSPQNIYIQSATLNGKPWRKSWFTHADLAAGGTLRLRMGPKPNLNWGSDLTDCPPSGMPAGFNYAALPAPSTNTPTIWSLPIRLVAGSDDPVGNFLPDLNMMQGQTNAADVNVDTTAAGAAPAGVYQSERYGSDFSYTFPVPRHGRYNVRLHFAEIFEDAPGQRLENVQINGQPVLTNFDVAATAGFNKAVVKDFPDITPDAQGNIVVRITAAPNSPDQNAKISGIEIMAR
ncbi:MAG: glycoside hydrolase family 92 protein [Abitibacteriaceae bacterium]|nr:glycoside hydrolase family 92 protein [Abditibacteriaceae bacterium]